MELTHDFLRFNVAKVELKRSIHLGYYFDVIQTKEQGEMAQETPSLITTNENEVYLDPGESFEIYLQNFNFHLQIKMDSGLKFDVCFDNDEELNRYLSLIEVVGQNKYFS